MDRHMHKKYQPQCPRQAAIVDQYMWKDKDTTYYKCYNGISHPIYDCRGWINYSLPLEDYPLVGEVHPQIGMTRRMHMNYRGDPHKRVPVHISRENFTHSDARENRVEGMYLPRRDSLPHTGMHLSSDRIPGYPLPNPYGDNRGCSACNCGRQGGVGCGCSGR